MEIRITTGTYNTSDYKVLKTYKSQKSAQKFISSLGYKGEIHKGLQFSANGITYNVI